MSTMPMWRQPPFDKLRAGSSAVSPGRSPADARRSKARSPANAAEGARARYPYFFAASAAILSITIAVDPPRAYTFPLAVTLSPAKGINFPFCPADGVVSAIGQ